MNDPSDLADAEVEDTEADIEDIIAALSRLECDESGDDFDARAKETRPKCGDASAISRAKGIDVALWPPRGNTTRSGNRAALAAARRLRERNTHLIRQAVSRRRPPTLLTFFEFCLFRS